MSSAHLHIVLNHVPVIGTVIVLFILSYGAVRKSDDIKKLAVIVFILISLFTIPVYTSGDGAEQIVQGMEGVDDEAIDAHEEAALTAFILMESAAGLTLLAFIFFRNKEVPSAFTILFFFILLIVLSLMAWTANLGGLIHHPEIKGLNEFL